MSLVGQSHFHCPNNVGPPHAFPKSFLSIYPGNNKGFSIENTLLYASPTQLLFAYLNSLLELLPYLPIGNNRGKKLERIAGQNSL